MRKEIEGIIPPLITPLIDDDTLDIEGLNRLIDHVIKGGVHGVFILGTTGEAQSLSFDLRVKMIEETCRILNRRLPLLVGISDTSVKDAVKLAYVAKENGADAVVSAPPYYYATGQTELAEFYEVLIPQLPLPVYLYNMPTHTKVSFAPETIKRIAEDPKVIGFKDSSANGGYFQSVVYEMRNRKNFKIFVGPEEMMAEAVLLGASGGVNGGANIFPELYVNLYNAAKRGDISEVQRLHKKVMHISRSIYTQGKYGSSYLKGVKCALNILGICSDTLVTPFKKFDGEPRRRIKKALEEMSSEEEILTIF